MASNQTNRNPRVQLTGWRLHPKAALILLGLSWCVALASALPQAWTAIRAALEIVGAFAAGMLVAKEAAIWQRTNDRRND